MKKKNPQYISTKEPASFDTEAMFPFEGIEEPDTANPQNLSSEEGSDTDGMIYCFLDNLFKIRLT